MRRSVRALFRSPPVSAISPHARVSRVTSSPTAGAFVPAVPSCSRWFSCTHCRQSTPANRDFSAATRKSAQRPDTQDTDDQSPSNISTGVETSARRLPLPPPLPYSPNSIPFKRHLELLKFSLSSSPDESWSTYQSLHPSLQRHVPNDLYIKLIRHQLQDGHEGYGRAKELVIFALDCGMELSELGQQVLELITESASKFDRKGRPRHIQTLEPEAELLREVWDIVVRVYSCRVDTIPEHLVVARLTWLQVHVRSSKEDVKAASISLALDIIEAFAPGRPTGLAASFADWFFLSKLPDDNYRLENARSLAFLLSHGVNISQRAVRRVLKATRRRVLATSPNDDREWEDLIARARLAANGPQADTANSILLETVRLIRRHDPGAAACGAPYSRTTRLLQQHQPDIPNLIRQCLKLLSRIYPEAQSSVAATRADSMTRALDLFERAALQPLSDVHVLVTVIITKMMVLRDVRDPQFPDLLARFIECLFSARLPDHLDSHLLHLLFDLTTNAMWTSPKAFNLMRRMYIACRGADDPYRWYPEKNRSARRWKAVFDISLSPNYQEIHFASRLYTDWLADGGTLAAESMLLFIRVIGSFSARTKYSLLERHVRDYLHFRSDDRQDLVRNLVKGLSARGRPRDAWLAFHLSRRVLGEEKTPTIAFEIPLDILSRSPRTIDNRRALEILEYLEKDDTRATEFYGVVFRGLSQMGPRYLSARRCHNVVAIVKEVYTQMTSKGVAVTKLHADCVVLVLLRAGHIDWAVQILKDAAQEKESVYARTVATAMRYLSRQARFAEALDLYDVCRLAVVGDGSENLRLDQATKELRLAQAVVLIMRGQDSRRDLEDMFGSKTLKRAEEKVRLGGAIASPAEAGAPIVISPTDALVWTHFGWMSEHKAVTEEDMPNVNEVQAEDYEIEQVLADSRNEQKE